MQPNRIDQVLESHPSLDGEDIRSLLVLAYINANDLHLNVQKHLDDTTTKLKSMKPHAIEALITSIK